MALTIFYDPGADQTVAYFKQGRNRFVAAGEWTEDEVKMALRLIRLLPVGSWNRAPQTVQFAIVLALAREIQAIHAAAQEFGAEEIFRSLAQGETVIGKKVAAQPAYITGVDILVVDPGTVAGDTYELVYDHAAQTLAWQKTGDTSVNIVAARDGKFDILDAAGALFVHVRVRASELPPESRTETFTIADVKSIDYLQRIADNYTSETLPRLMSETDADYRARILDVLREIRVTKWGMQRALKSVLGYMPRIEERREWFEDWFVAGKAVMGSAHESEGGSTVDDDETEIKHTSAPVTEEFSVELVATEHNIVREQAPNNVHSGELIRVGLEGNTKKIRSYIKFDVSSIPTTATILTAQCNLYYYDRDNAIIGEDVNVHEVTAAWSEATITWNNQPTFEGTEASQVAFTESIFPPFTGLASLVQSWLTGGQKSLVLKLDVEGSGNKQAWFWRKDGPVIARPRLVVTYEDTAPFPHIDTRLREEAPTTNYGLETSIRIGTEAASARRNRALLQFDLSDIPPTDIVFEARLEIYALAKGASADGNAFGIHAVTQAWEEEAATWNTHNASFDPANEGDVNMGTAINEYKQSEDIAALVSRWHQGVQENYGMMLIADDDESPLNDYWDISSKDGDLAKVPVLRVRHGTIVEGVPVENVALITAARSSINAGFAGNSSMNYALKIRVKEADVDSEAVAAAVIATKPAARIADVTSGYGQHLATFLPKDAVLPASGGATYNASGASDNVRADELVFAAGVESRAFYIFETHSFNATTDKLVVAVYYQTDDTDGRALFGVEERSIDEGSPWDVTMGDPAEAKFRAPFSASDVREELVEFEPNWDPNSMARFALVRKGDDPIDDLAGNLRVLCVRIFRRT